MSIESNSIEQFVAESSGVLTQACTPTPSTPRPTRQRLLATIEQVSEKAIELELDAFAMLLSRARDHADDLDALTKCCKTALDYLEQLGTTGAIEPRDLSSDNDPAIDVFASDADEPEVELAAPGSSEWTELTPRGQDAVDQTLADVQGTTTDVSEPSAAGARSAEPLISARDELDVLAELGLDEPADVEQESNSAAPVSRVEPPEVSFNVTEFLADLDSIIPTEASDGSVQLPSAAPVRPADSTIEPSLTPSQDSAPVMFEPASPTDVVQAPATIGRSVPPPPSVPAKEGEFWGSRRLNLPQDKMENLVFIVGDLKDQSDRLQSVIKDLAEIELRQTACEQLAEVADAIRTPAEEYKLAILDQFADLLVAVGERIGIVSEPVVAEVLVRVRAIHHLLTQLTGRLEVTFESNWPVATMRNRMSRLLEDRQLHRSIVGLHQNDPEKVLELDRVTEGLEAPPTPPDEDAEGVELDGVIHEIEPAGEVSPEASTAGADARKSEQIVRIELSRIEELLGVVSQLVMCKNQICAILREAGKPGANRQDAGQSRSASIEIDRLTARLQAGLLQARTLPLARLFDRFPRMVRDIGRMKEKDIELTLLGQGAQVDKRVMDLLAEPLAHVLKFRAADGIETGAVRVTSGKPATGAMRLEADNQDSHVLVRIWDDGLELQRDVVQKIVVENGIVSAEHARTMEDADLLALVLHPDYPGSGSATTARNLDQLNAQVRVQSSHAKGTVFEIFFPLNVGIMSAMMARVDGEVYAIPQKTVMEVARLKPEQQFPVCKQPSMFLREQVVTLVDLTSALHGKMTPTTERVAVVVQVGDQRAGLLVDEVLGQQQVVIKELDTTCNHSDLFSGATLLEDGRVSLILNVMKLLRVHSARPALARAA